MKGAVIFFIGLIVLSSFVVAAENDTSGGSLQERIEATDQQVEAYRDMLADNSLSGQWRQYLLERPFVQKMDAFLQKISGIFSVLMGMPYSLTLLFFLTFVLWCILFFTMPSMMVFIQNETLKFFAGVAALILLSHLGFVLLIARGIAGLATLLSSNLLISSIIIIVAVVLFAVLLGFGSRYTRAYSKERRQKNLEEESKKERVLRETLLEDID